MATLPTEIMVALGATFALVALLTGLVVSALLSRQSMAQRRLEALQHSNLAEHVVLSGSLTAGRDPKLARLDALLPRSVRDMSRIERRLASAGIVSKPLAITVKVAELLLPVAGAAAALSWYGLRSPTGWLGAVLLGFVGAMLPGFYLDMRVSGRRKRIRQGLPDVLDLLIVCLEAGSSLDQAVVKASEELALAYPDLADELRILITETRAGKPRLEAFKNLAQRTRVDEIRALVAMLVQTDRFGTSVAQALRTMADDMRMKRRQAAEEMAAKVGVKLVFPLVLCLFPALYVVILGPAVLVFMYNFPQ